jgi:hypothetical protein
MTDPVVAPASTEPVVAPAAAADGNLVTGADQAAKPAETSVAAPESYQPFTMPEGVTLDETSFKEFSAVAKELGLSQENAQKVASIAPSMIQRTAEALTQHQAEQKAAQIEKWKTEVKTDKDFGGDKLQQTLTHANAFVQNYGGQELLAVLDEHGLSNHPAVIKALASAGKALLPDTILNGGASHVPADPLAAMYPSMQPTVQ